MVEPRRDGDDAGQAQEMDRRRALGRRSIPQLAVAVVAPGPDGTIGRQCQAVIAPGCHRSDAERRGQLHRRVAVFSTGLPVAQLSEVVQPVGTHHPGGRTPSPGEGHRVGAAGRVVRDDQARATRAGGRGGEGDADGAARPRLDCRAGAGVARLGEVAHVGPGQGDARDSDGGAAGVGEGHGVRRGGRADALPAEGQAGRADAERGQRRAAAAAPPDAGGRLGGPDRSLAVLEADVARAAVAAGAAAGGGQAARAATRSHRARGDGDAVGDQQDGAARAAARAARHVPCRCAAGLAGRAVRADPPGDRRLPRRDQQRTAPASAIRQAGGPAARAEIDRRGEERGTVEGAADAAHPRHTLAGAVAAERGVAAAAADAVIEPTRPAVAAERAGAGVANIDDAVVEALGGEGGAVATREGTHEAAGGGDSAAALDGEGAGDAEGADTARVLRPALAPAATGQGRPAPDRHVLVVRDDAHLGAVAVTRLRAVAALAVGVLEILCEGDGGGAHARDDAVLEAAHAAGALRLVNEYLAADREVGRAGDWHDALARGRIGA